MHRGFVKLWRKMQDWEWYRDSHTFHLFMHLLLSANHEDYKFQGHSIPRGSCVVGTFSLMEQTGMSFQNIRTGIKHLKSTNDIDTIPTNKFTIVCIANYSKYQDHLTNKNTSSQQTTNKQLTTIKEVKNEKNNNVAFNDQQMHDLKAVIAQVMGWGIMSDAVRIEADRIIHKIQTSKKMIKRPIAYAIGIAKKLKEGKYVAA